MTMRLPNVLIIGAMKAGTTGLYRDLAAHPDVFLSGDKEPHALCSDKVLTGPGLNEYAKRYKGAVEATIIDASTGYAKRPDYQGVASRAVQVLPEGFKVIYLVRDPVERIISQHYHEYSRGEASPNIDQAVREHSRYVDYSRYAYQLEPWIEAVGIERILLVRFEDYTGDRRRIVAQVYGFLGLSELSELLDTDKVYNKSQDKPVHKGLWSVVFHNSIYRKVLRPLMTVEFRMRLARLLLPKAPQKPASPSDETRAWLEEELAEDSQRLVQLLERGTLLGSPPGEVPKPIAEQTSAS